MKKSIVFSILAAIAAPTWALSTDKSQPIEVHADQFNGDEVKQTAVYSGNVVVDQGSMNLTGARLDLAITPKGYRRATITGSPARFKQQRDPKTKGVEEWVHAHASRITYDEETDKVTLEGKAQLSRSENGQQKDHDERRAHRLRHAQRPFRSQQRRRQARHDDHRAPLQDRRGHAASGHVPLQLHQASAVTGLQRDRKRNS